MRALYLGLKFAAIAAAVALTMLVAPEREKVEAGAPAELRMDFDISDGACVDIDAATTVNPGDNFQIAICLDNPFGSPISSFNFDVDYNDAIVLAPEEPDVAPALDDNPNANVGGTTFTSPTYPNDLGAGWACAPPYPRGDYDGLANGTGRAFIVCLTATGPYTLVSGPLAVVTFAALSVGPASLTFSDVAVYDDTLTEIGSCNPVQSTSMTCVGGTATVTDESLALDFNISDGACVDIDSTTTVVAGASFDVAVCLANSTANEVDSFVFGVNYDNNIAVAPEVADVGTALDDNPDANAGATTFTSLTFPNSLGASADCGSAFDPIGDWYGIPQNGDTFAAIACNSLSSPTLESGPLSVITFDALAAGTTDLTLSGVQVVAGSEIGSCNPVMSVPMVCIGGSVTVLAADGLSLDFNISDGACVDIDAAATMTVGGSLDVGVCLTNTTGNEIAAFQYRVFYDDRLVKAPEEADAAAALDDNPNANAGTETFTSATYPDHLGSGWDCAGGVGAWPTGDVDGILANGNGRAYSGACGSIGGPHQLVSGPLGVVTFNALGAGLATLTLEGVTVHDENLVQIGSCNPTDIEVMTCAGGTITVQPGNSTINGKVYVNSLAPGNVFSGALVQANGLGNAVSDAAGNYTISGLPAGSYTVSATTQAPFTGASIGPVSLLANQFLSGNDIIITGPTGGVTGTAYRDSAIPANVMAGAVVEACAAVCRTAVTNASGVYTVPYLPDGSYTLTLFPTGDYRQVSVSPVVVSGGVVAAAPNLVTTLLVAPPAGTVTPVVGNALQPGVFAFDPFTLTRIGCAGGSASYTITQGSFVSSGSMAEGPAGTYTAVVSPLTGAGPGQAIVVITIDCPSDPDQVLEFGINVYIDPSGFVRNMEGEPIAGATVILYWSDDYYGPYVQLANNHPHMSPANRSNPDLTDATGHFGWDVAAGFYKVQATKAGCLVPEAFKRSAFKRSETTFESATLTIPPAVTDLDLRLDCTPNPCNSSDPTIPNSDAAPLENGPLAPGTDITIAHGDINNDSCDADDDNDGILDIYEGGFPVTGCPSATGPLGALQMDTDGDRLTDGWECASGSDPANPASKSFGSGTGDADGDHVADLWEQRGYNSSGASTDTDGDGCADLVEIASIDGNKTSGDSDRLAVARRALNVWGAEPQQDYVLDINKDGVVSDPDRLFVARAVLLVDWLPKVCPP